MRLILFGTEIPTLLRSALAEEGFRLEVAPAGGAPPAVGAVGALAAALREAESALRGAPPSAVLVTGGGDRALGVALAAVKLGVPTAWISPPDAEVEVHLTRRVADLTVDATQSPHDSAREIAEMAASTLRSR
ncbi:MAG: hypothetical protein ABI726_00445 [bacterium]